MTVGDVSCREEDSSKYYLLLWWGLSYCCFVDSNEAETWLKKIQNCRGFIYQQ